MWTLLRVEGWVTEFAAGSIVHTLWISIVSLKNLIIRWTAGATAHGSSPDEVRTAWLGCKGLSRGGYWNNGRSP